MEGTQIAASAQALEAAVLSLLNPGDAHRQHLANEWINRFLREPQMWTVALYVAFPPDPNAAPAPESRFFVLNLLLSKLRSDWLQLSQVDAVEIFEVLLRQLPLNLNNRAFSNRLCVVLSAAAGVAGAKTCNQLVNHTLEADVGNKSALSLAINLLTALADETLHRARTLPWEVEHCMQSLFPQVLNFLQTVISCTSDFELQASSFICLERWIQAGVTLSEVFSDCPALFEAMLNSLGSPDENCVIAGSSALSEMISSVDLLPSRDEAVHAVISAVLKFKGDFTAANRKRSHALCVLITAIGCAESALLSKGGDEELRLLEWIVEATSGAGGLGIEGATMAAEVWPRLAARVSGQLYRAQVFHAAAQAVLKVATYPLDEFVEIDEDFYGFRRGVAEDVLAAAFKELGSTFLKFFLERLLQSSVWQEAEVCLYAVSCLRQQIGAIANQRAPPKYAVHYEEYSAVTGFLLNVFRGDSGCPTILETVSRKWPHGKLVESAVHTIKGHAKWIALESTALEKAVSYTLTALSISEAKGAAAETLQELCKASAPHLAAARAFSLLMGACEQAIATTLGGMQTSESITLIGGLAAVASALPIGEAETTIACLTATAVTTIKELSPRQTKTVEDANSLGSALKLITTVVEFGTGESNLHPAIPVFEDIWSALDILGCNWANDVVVASSLCELWGMLATNIGVRMQNVLPRVISIVADMFKQHLVAPCLDCLSSIAPLISCSDGAGKEITMCMTSALSGIIGTIGPLELIANRQEPSALESLGAICRLGRACLRYVPSSVPAGSYGAIFACALGLLQTGDGESAVGAAAFLAEAIYGGSLTEGDDWRIPEVMSPQLNSAIFHSVTPLVETVLKQLAHGQVTLHFKEALVNVLYSLVTKHTVATEAAIVSFINSPKFPARPGILSDSTKRQFVLAASRRGRSRRMFQELMSDFSRVCQALSAAEVLFEY